MKLYTEEQVQMAIQMGDKYHYLLETEEDGILKSLTPIELPSDEEISEVAMVVYGFDARNIKDVLEYKAFKRGAKYVINKIQGGNNEQQ